MNLEIQPLVPQRWPDFVSLFAENSLTNGCACMWFRETRSQFQQNYGEGNRQAMRAIVNSGEVPGLLGYLDGKPVGWIAVAPREAHAVLARSRVLKPVDEQPVWSVVCFFTSKPYRRQGVTLGLLNAAVDYAARQGAKIVEGYPVIPRSEKEQVSELYHGIYSTFLKAGFVEVARRSERRPILRKIIQ